MDLIKLFGSFKFKKLGMMGNTDFGVLKVAYMIAAALDGEMSEAGLIRSQSAQGGLTRCE